jgi:hypothetical protein
MMTYRFYIRNTNPLFWLQKRKRCNCGSFAMNMTSWFTPYDNNSKYTEPIRSGIIRDMYEEGYSKEDIYEEILERDCKEILRTCPWIEQIELEEARWWDKLIAYRIWFDEDALTMVDTVDDDFHFRIRICGLWFEKCGEDPIRFCGFRAAKKEWKTSEYLIYDSRTIYFRYKRKFDGKTKICYNKYRR